MSAGPASPDCSRGWRTNIAYFFEGLIIGFAVPIPIGPVGVLCIRRTISSGKMHGLLTGLSAAISDMTYSIVAAFGITFVSGFIAGHQPELRCIGGIILLVFGYRTFLPHPEQSAAVKQILSPTLTFFSTFLVTYSNPMAVLAYAAAFAWIGAGNLVHHRTDAVFLVAGVFLGSFTWFSLLTILSSALKHRIPAAGFPVVNKIAGSILMLFGAIALWSGATRW